MLFIQEHYRDGFPVPDSPASVKMTDQLLCLPLEEM